MNVREQIPLHAGTMRLAMAKGWFEVWCFVKTPVHRELPHLNPRYDPVWDLPPGPVSWRER